jgi:hypothetical protein
MNLVTEGRRSGEKGQSKQPEVNRSLLRTASAANAAPCFHRRNPNAVKKTLCLRSGCIRSGAPPPIGKTPTTPAKRQGNVQLDLEATPAPLLRHLRSATPAERARDARRSALTLCHLNYSFQHNSEKPAAQFSYRAELFIHASARSG